MSRHLVEYGIVKINDTYPKALQEVRRIYRLILDQQLEDASKLYFESEYWIPEIEIKLAQAELSKKDNFSQHGLYKKALAKLAKKAAESPNLPILQYMLGDDLAWYQSLCKDDSKDIFGKDGIPDLKDLSDIALCVYFLHDLIQNPSLNQKQILEK
ncbi:MAG: hypothetical protein CBE08_004300, partial [Euryarchaeota archaeon TMED248]